MVNDWAITQSTGFSGQLECGARAFDVRPYQKDDGSIIMHHGDVKVGRWVGREGGDVGGWVGGWWGGEWEGGWWWCGACPSFILPKSKPHPLLNPPNP